MDETKTELPENKIKQDTDAQETPRQETNEIDAQKRKLFFGLASVGSLLAACAPPQKTPEEGVPGASTKYIPPESGETISNTGNTDIGIQTHMPMPGGPGGGTPGAGGGPGPGGGTGGMPPAVNAPVPGPSIQTAPSIHQMFTSLKEFEAVLLTSDMMMAAPQQMADNNFISVWGFTDVRGEAFNAQQNRLCPGPVVEVIEGQTSSITLNSMHPHTIHLHGLDVNMANDGVPATSGYVGMGGGPGAVPTPGGGSLGPSFDYTFVAPHAGTYFYHCHVDTALHMEMGMSGTIIVRPPDGNPQTSWMGSPVFDKEYVWQLHTFDSRWHSGVLQSGVNTQRYSPNYFMINGVDGNNLLLDPATRIDGVAGERILIRLVNLGYMPAIVNLGGILFDVEASDGRPLASPILSQSEYRIGPGERYDIFFTIPTTASQTASVKYLDITGRSILGQALTTINAI